MKYCITVLTLFVLILFVSPSLFAYEKIFYLSNKPGGVESLKKNIDSIDVIAPQNYVISPNLTASGSIPLDIRNLAKKEKKKIMPLIMNQGFRQDIVHGLLVSPAAQDRIINYMIKEAEKYGYVGWQLDIENISYKDRNLYTNFVIRASKAFAKKKLELSVAAIARINDEQTEFYKNWSGAFDYAKIAPWVTFISIMTYDDPNSKGPTASLPYIKEVFTYLEGKVSPGKISLGIPLYYWGWSMNPSKRVQSGGTFANLSFVRSTYKHYEGYNEILKVPFIVYYNNNKPYILWHDDERSITEKLNFMKEKNLRGFSAWALGQENPSVWKAFKKIPSGTSI